MNIFELMVLVNNEWRLASIGSLRDCLFVQRKSPNAAYILRRVK